MVITKLTQCLLDHEYTYTTPGHKNKSEQPCIKHIQNNSVYWCAWSRLGIYWSVISLDHAHQYTEYRAVTVV